MYDINQWEHVFKLDPNKEINDKDLEDICESGTDAIMVGGTDGVTLDQVLSLLARIRRFTVPVILEISNMESVTPGYDYYFVPTVLNSADKEWTMGMHHKAVQQYGAMIDWDEMMLEGYCILNPESKAYQRTNCDMPNEEEIIAYAEMAEHMFKLPIFYVEYSGMYGDAKIVEQVSHVLKHTLLFYGGGIASEEQAREMKQYADVVVVGNVIYENKKAALKTVRAVKERE
ncbi:heptaprenylglyceryl phosphate synthase [Pontibacillus litoralis]|uniref:Heptaprenylglyceryl phosphate synthase n=1 Tax=Pontibacillus litoralis JSM 072002 TaxID=1385512 RepID=A0A0A5G534_9BACI|nr:heptaprenylglyceryl phosphate synthase [Pontibacillus litoralis]KGX88236.1 geranylgeranylglyceryl phosphate synthase [Pontibacillus litoralis JSM 072002]